MWKGRLRGVVSALFGLLAPAAVLAAGEPVGKIASVQNLVEARAAASSEWTPAAVDRSLAPQDRIRTGAASRAAILYADRTLHRMNEKSEVEVQPPADGKPGLLRVLSGGHYFSSRSPKDYGRVETPTVTAAIRGTEFAVEVAADGTTTISMLEGVVAASNPFGSIEVAAGEQAFVEPGKAPVRRILVRPADAVAWTFYYPPVLGGADARTAGPDLEKAAALLAAGQVEQAAPLIEAVRRERPDDPVALALSSVTATAAGRRDEARALAERAVASGPNSAAAQLALSYAAQSSFDVPAARRAAEAAARMDPDSSAALARVAELRLGEGDLDGAQEAARRAVARQPDARALAVLGFTELARHRTDEAASSFDRAVEADPGLALARMGRGIAWIRQGKVAAGREELQSAAALDPGDALVRSYLGKAWSEERRTKEALKELDAARRLDPNDPTPWLYGALVKQNANRPVEALADLREAIARNDNRQVYRSRMLLDRDEAVRGADLARIYNDLGFEQPGLVAARRSADADQANFSSHLFLSGAYRSLPSFAPAFLSEVLQARIYQPTGVNAVRPDVVAETVSYNEYSALFDRPQVRGFANVSYGRTDDDLRSLVPDDVQCLRPDGTLAPCIDVVSLDGPGVATADLTATSTGDRYAAALSWRGVQDDGFRSNSDRDDDTFRGFVQFSPTWRDSFQLNAQVGDQVFGDLPLRQIPVLITPERFDTTLTNVGLGWHRTLGPRADLAVSGIWNDLEQSGASLVTNSRGTASLRGPQLEAQYVLRQSTLSWIFGAGAFDGTVELDSGQAGTVFETDDTFRNGYAYLKWRAASRLEVTGGISAESADAPVGYLPPRDSRIVPSDLSVSESRVSPKLGVTYALPGGTTLRAAGFERLAPAIGRIQTLEPTQVAGFNQMFEDPGGTRSRAWGVGADQDMRGRLYAGVSYLQRRRDVPEPQCASPDPFGGCAGQPGVAVVERRSDDDLWSVYLNAPIGSRFAVGVDWYRESRDTDETVISPVGLFQDRFETERVRPQARFFLPNGFFAALWGTRYDQEVDQFDDLSSAARTTVESAFWVLDAQVGWKLPRRIGSVALQARNLSDREFEFYQRTVQETVIPARTILLTVTVTP